LGIAALEDKIVQQAVVTILNQIYEVDFKGFSYGFRPGRSPHQALDALTVGIQRKRVNWVLDADIRGFFDNLSHEWTMKFIEHRVADRRILRLMQKWLKAGVSEDGQWSETKLGTPQGAVVTPLTQKVILTVRRLRSSVLGRTRGNRNAMANGNCIFADQNVFN
jgi:retron-type reverse transcriptase